MKKLLILSIIVVFTIPAFTQPPQKFSYQAVLRDKDGNLLVNQLVGMRTTILQGSTIQLVVYQETYTFTATNENGLLTVEIGSGKPTIVSGPFTSIPWSSGPFFLKTEIDPAGGTNYTITGQSQILSVPYALYAEKTGTVTETDPVWTASASSYYTKSNLRQPGEAEVLFGNISSKPATLAGYGITDAMATSHPANLITQSEITKWNTPHSGDVSGSLSLTVTGLRGRNISETAPVTGQVLSWDGSSWSPGNDGFILPFSGQTTAGNSGIEIQHNATSGSTYGGIFANRSTSGTAVAGFATAFSGLTYGGLFLTQSRDGIGIDASATNSTGTNYGGRFTSNSDEGTGVFGLATSISGSTVGVKGISNSTLGAGVWGSVTASSGINSGVYGISSSPQGNGVQGVATDPGGPNNGVHGISNSTVGVGVKGEANASTGANVGIFGSSNSSGGFGVFGAAYSNTGINYGVWGTSNSSEGIGLVGKATAESGKNYGIIASTNSSEGYAGYFQGRVHISGTLSKSAGSFKIDHPLDPENKWLSHSFVESPDMMNIYNGNAILNSQGEITVILPEWFEALNKDFRYQLTAIGSPGPDLYISQEIENNQFQIAGGKPGMKVSWQVTGIRKDAYAEKNRIRVEEDKTPDERGKYMHPGLFGQPEEKGVQYFKNK